MKQNAAGHENLHRGLKLIPAAAQVSVTKRLRAHELKIRGDETGMICRGNLGQRSVDDEDLLQ